MHLKKLGHSDPRIRMLSYPLVADNRVRPFAIGVLSSICDGIRSCETPPTWFLAPSVTSGAGSRIIHVDYTGLGHDLPQKQLSLPNSVRQKGDLKKPWRMPITDSLEILWGCSGTPCKGGSKGLVRTACLSTFRIIQHFRVRKVPNTDRIITRAGELYRGQPCP